MAYERYNFSSDFQDTLIAAMLRHPEKFIGVQSALDFTYFTGLNTNTTAKLVLDYAVKYNVFPSFTALGQLAYQHTKQSNSEDFSNDLTEYVKMLSEITVRDVEYILSQVVNFARERALLIEITKCAKNIQEGKDQGDMVERFQKVMSIGMDLSSMGMEAKEDADAVLDKILNPSYGVSTGYELLDNHFLKRGMGRGWLIVPLAPPKGFKCLGKGTGILMSDGSVKPVEQVAVGDLIMGDDSSPRRVLTCGHGTGPLYSVTQTSGKDFVCNDAHVLCVKSKKGIIQEISAEDYSKKTKWFKREWNGYKTGVNFPARSVPLDPYFLGLWLGDGTTGKPHVTVANKDSEVAEYLRVFAHSLGMRITITPETGCARFSLAISHKRKSICTFLNCKNPHRAGGFCQKHYNYAYYRNFRALPEHKKRWENPVNVALIALGVFKDKHIPNGYKINNRATRLRLLAGLIDSDGHYVKNKGLIFTNTNEHLAQDTCWLARSLGLHASIAPYKTTCKAVSYTGTCWRVVITGRLSEIPTLLSRKQAKDSTKKWGGRYSIDVTPVGTGDYYGFTLDGNQRFLLNDFTVTHNTTFCLNLAMNIAGPLCGGEHVVYYACEINEELALERVYCAMTQQTIDQGIEDPETFRARVHEELEVSLQGKLYVKHFPAKSIKVSDIRAHLRALVAAKGFAPRVVVIDYAETVLPEDSTAPEYRQSASIYTAARALADEFGVTVIMPDRCNKETVEQAVPSMTSFQGAFEKGGIVDAAIGICATPDEYRRNIIRLFVFLYRYGPAGLHFKGRIDPDKYTITVDQQLEWNDLMALNHEMAEVRQERHGKRRAGARRRDGGAAEDQQV